MPAIQTVTNAQHYVMPFAGLPLHVFRKIPVCVTPVNIYKSGDGYKVMVFAPGRQKENFSVSVCGEELIIDYSPVHDNDSLHWLRQEFAQTGFERTFLLDDPLDAGSIAPEYEDGVFKFCVRILLESHF